MAAEGKTIAMVAALGAGGYLFYEYYRYSSSISTAVNGDPTQISAVEQTLPFFTYLSMLWGGTGTAAQVQIYNVIQSILSGTTTSTTTPGTTSSTQVTSVSTAPSSTPTANGSTAPSTTSQNLPPTAPARVPISQAQPGLAQNMQNAIGMTVANADQWNYAYHQVTGSTIESHYSFNFDAVYGPVVGGHRSSGTMSATVFLQMAANAAGVAIGTVLGGKTTFTGGSHLRGLGTIVRLAGPTLNTTGNLIYQAHHPFPYVPTYTLRGLGAVVQASGFEKALFTDQTLRSNRVR